MLTGRHFAGEEYRGGSTGSDQPTHQLDSAEQVVPVEK